MKAMPENSISIEAQVKEDNEKMQAVFAARAIYRQALEAKNNVELKSIMVAPEGFLYKITALSDEALTRVHIDHKSNQWLQNLEAGEIVYAPQIDSTREINYTTYTFTSWLNGPEEPVFSHSKQGFPVRINSTDIDLELISVEEYAEKRLVGDKTLFRVNENETPEAQ